MFDSQKGFISFINFICCFAPEIDYIALIAVWGCYYAYYSYACSMIDGLAPIRWSVSIEVAFGLRIIQIYSSKYHLAIFNYFILTGFGNLSFSLLS